MAMSLRLFASTWLGWTTGVLFISTPWGPPSFKSWKSWLSLWSICVILIQHYLLIDFAQQTKLADALAVNQLAKTIHDVMFVVGYAAFWTVRLVLLIHAKELAKLLTLFYKSPLKAEYNRWRKAWRVAIFFMCLSATLLTTSAGVFMLALRTKTGQGWLYVSGQLFSGFIGAFFGHLCSTSATNVGFAMVTYISFYLGMIYCDFCNGVEEFLKIGNTKIFSSKEFGIVEKEFDGNFKKKIFLHTNIQSCPLLSKEILLNKFERIQDIFETGNKIVSPLAFVVIVIETFRGVSLAHEMLINNLGGLFMLDNYLNVTQQIIHAGLVFVGQCVEDKMAERKKQLEKMVALLEDTGANHQQIIKYVTNFEWKVSAYGFFIVDKKLLSGMAATAMTYIVILVQLQISLHSTACFSQSIQSANTDNSTQFVRIDHL